MNTDCDIVNHIRQTAEFYKPPYGLMDRYMIKHAKSFKRRKFGRYAKGTPKQCYSNASHLVFEHKTLRYVEGYVSCFMPIPHAWCIDRAGHVIDVTLDDKNPRSYFGVVVPTDLLREQLLKTKMYGVLTGAEMYDIDFMRKLGPLDELDEAFAAARGW